MSDYKKALQEGFEAAKRTRAAIIEIASVLNTFRQQILEESEERISIDLKEFEEELSLSERLAAGVGPFEKTPKKRTYKALIASNPKVSSSPRYQLAIWRQARDGYPCNLAYNKQDIQFFDRLALENGLAELLKDPVVGEALYKLLNLKPQ